MHKLLATTTATRPTGSPPQRKLFKISNGYFKGRLAALYQNSSSGIVLQYANYPYSTWSDAQLVASNCHDSPFSAIMDSNGNIYIAFSGTDLKIRFVKLTFSSGFWGVGSPVNAVSVDNNYNPFIFKDDSGKLWCFFVNHRISVDSNYYVRAISSVNDGQNWGTGDTDLGAQLSAATSQICYVTACQVGSLLYAIYATGRSNLNYRAYDLAAAAWDSENSIHSGDYIDDDFAVTVSADKRLGLTFAVSTDAKLYFKEFNGSYWSGNQEIEAALSRSPQIKYLGNLPHIIYGKHLGSGYYLIRHAYKSADNFISFDFSPFQGLFDMVFLYNELGGTKFQDKTGAAANESSGDIFHSESSALVAAIGDCIYLGKQSRFFCAAIVLSTAGANGTVAWEYHNGAQWISFTPHSGAYNLDSNDKLVYLWQDADSIPAGWQMNSVNGYSAYWVRARVVTGFSSTPVGTQIIAAAKSDDISLELEGA